MRPAVPTDGSLPAAARCVIVGGGVGGASVAHHLARLGWRDIVVLEQHELTEGTTWHSAGFVGQLRSTISQTRMIMYSSDLYTTPDEAGLGFAVQIDKAGGFIGRDALVAARAGEGEPRPRLRCLVLDDPLAVCLGNEPVRAQDALLGRVTSGGYGHRVDKSIAYAYLPSDLDVGTRVEIGIFGQWIGAQVARDPLYDPGNERVRGVRAPV